MGDGIELGKNMNFNEIFRAYKDVFLLLYEFHLKNKLHLIWGNHDMVLRKHKRTKKLLDSYFDERIVLDIEGFKDIALFL